MPGGATSSSKRPYRNLGNDSQANYAVKALSGSETFANPDNLQLFNGAGEPYSIDTEFGISNFNLAPANGEDTQGNGGFKTTTFTPPKNNITPPKKGDATPGGGW